MSNPYTQAWIYMFLWMIGVAAFGIYALTRGTVISLIGGVGMLIGAAIFLVILVRALWLRRSGRWPPPDE